MIIMNRLLTEVKLINLLEDLDVESCEDNSELLHRIVEGDILNENSKQCETNAKDIMKFLENNLIPKMKEKFVEFKACTVGFMELGHITMD